MINFTTKSKTTLVKKNHAVKQITLKNISRVLPCEPRESNDEANEWVQPNEHSPSHTHPSGAARSRP